MHQVMFQRIKFRYKSSACTLIIWHDGEAKIEDLYSSVKRKGHATKLLTKVMKYVDKHNLEVSIVAEHFGENSFKKNSDLAKFYKKFGFKPIKDQSIQMSRKAKKE